MTIALKISSNLKLSSWNKSIICAPTLLITIRLHLKSIISVLNQVESETLVSYHVFGHAIAMDFRACKHELRTTFNADTMIAVASCIAFTTNIK